MPIGKAIARFGDAASTSIATPKPATPTITSRTSIACAGAREQRAHQRADADHREQDGERAVAAVERAW